ncbi:hypothetical protein FE257_011395 [Aspergillus nanangensis]|uniref:Uncharacterized protein n=1 Tax=Aspergillus nanangensis TaxID=2582783 RepID=A0AAD4CIQ5_ASPNN|nr:hypothetical protein FE257_011395 [Aspergillus nanangensis]
MFVEKSITFFTILLFIFRFFAPGHALPTLGTSKSLEDVLTNINAVADSYVIFHGSIQKYHGGPESLSTLQLQESIVEDHLTDSIDAAAGCPPLDDTGSKQIMTALGKPYPTFMSELLGNITEKKPIFERNSAKPAVLEWLRRLRRLSNELPDALERITVDSDSKEIEKGVEWSNTLFGMALDAYKA